MPASIQTEFRESILRPTLERIAMHSPAAERLLFGTAMHESAGLGYLRQWPAGPALGVYQMERATLADLWTNYLRFRPVTAGWLGRAKIAEDPEGAVNLLCPVYATVAARLHYARDPEPLPEAEDAEGLARIYKRVWNGPGKASEADFIAALTQYEEAS